MKENKTIEEKHYYLTESQLNILKKKWLKQARKEERALLREKIIKQEERESAYITGINYGVEIGKKQERALLREKIEGMVREELFVGESQYRYEKGNIAFVYNSALDDILKILE
jgi:hypothetical protein